ncbi:MAG: spore coat protein CotJB [Clostridiales bacterium]|nr:spore coat protein CotJB [Clostridiales bacterium]
MMHPSEKQKLLSSIYQYGFAMDDTRLYLDTHPEDCEALAYFREMAERYHDAVRTWEENVGPLNQDWADVSDGWAWICDPWPWEGGMC